MWLTLKMRKTCFGDNKNRSGYSQEQVSALDLQEATREQQYLKEIKDGTRN